MPDRFNPLDRRNATSPSDPQSSDPIVHLEVTRGRTRYRFRPVAPPAFLIGSAPDCDLVLGDHRFPDVHACLLLRSREVSIRHLGFEPGLLVNGQPVGRAALAHGDTIQTGPYEFRLLVVPPEGDDPTAALPRPDDQQSMAPQPRRPGRRHRPATFQAPPLELNMLPTWLQRETSAPRGSDLDLELRRLATGSPASM